MIIYDVIITTCNRPVIVCDFVQNILLCNKQLPDNIIVVDSSDCENKEIQNQDRVTYIRSSHKNQPYQRLLGASMSINDIIVYFDDDLLITNKDIFEIILDGYKHPNVVGSSVGFKFSGTNIIGKQYKKLNLGSLGSYVYNFLTGVPNVKRDKIGLIGAVGGRDEGEKVEVEYFSGAVMSFKRDIALKLFSDVLLSLYDMKMCKGEDKFLSFGATKYGKLIYNSTICLEHPNEESSYFQDNFSFCRKEIYSRLVHSLRYCEITNFPRGLAYLHYCYYAAWRIIIALITFLLGFKKKNLDKLKGRCKGVADTFIIPPSNRDKICNSTNWAEEVSKDIRIYECVKK